MYVCCVLRLPAACEHVTHEVHRQDTSQRFTLGGLIVQGRQSGQYSTT